ncbi:MAG: citrate lyase acyl carrier protein [Oscillospiraceae bacterium]|nr:citrate lyase acyl carrier protein [Oscillospiraceae bacterium]
MEIIKKASAGTMESSDAYVEIEPAQNLQIQLESVVQAQFGQQIRQAIEDVLQENGVEKANVRLVDRGALECVIRARVETAILRGREEA